MSQILNITCASNELFQYDFHRGPVYIEILDTIVGSNEYPFVVNGLST